MIGWRRRAKAARESTVSPERLYELVNQTLMENFGPLGSYAITMRSVSDTDDIFHTALAKSVSHDIVANLAEHGIAMRAASAHAGPAPLPLAPVENVFVPRQLARAVSRAVPAYPAVAPGIAIGAAPLIDGPDPRDDDALRSLVAHHAEVTEAMAQKAAASDIAI
ncbi:hypothetical protein VD659_00980 [Herbiconiux sp. 11R-BC]|uniref:hypothetical protein n=1 Tax=Herbiconiux sp. 11R-BC TaxID=3111637 RepID=UPI003C0DF258